MKKKASYCIDCQHHSLSGVCSEVLKCAKGWKPRFYPPKGKHWPFLPLEDWGWKRICDSFKRIKDENQANPRY